MLVPVEKIDKEFVHNLEELKALSTEEILSLGRGAMGTLGLYSLKEKYTVEDYNYEFFKAGLQVLGVRLAYPVLPQEKEGKYFILWTNLFEEYEYSVTHVWGEYTLGLPKN